MVILDNTDREGIWAEFMARQKDRTAQDFGALVKADLRAAVDALDNWLDTNDATINAAIPQPARAELTKQQKALLLEYVISRRYLRS